MTETRIWTWRRGAALLEGYFAINQTCHNKLELDILPREMNIDIEGGVIVVYEFPATLPW